MRALIALGANLGDRRETLNRAVERLQAHPAITSLARSHWHETAPVGGPSGQGAFLNGAVALDTSLSSEQLLAVLHDVENSLGRVRGERWEARLLDLDLLLFGDEVRVDPRVAVPHPRMAFRRFVLAPAAEVAAEMVHPLVGWSVGKLLAHLDSTPLYVALSGVPGAGKTALAQALSQSLWGQGVPTTLLSDPAASGGASPAGPAYPRQVEFVQRRAHALDRGHWPADTLAISDFWFDECLAHAQTELTPAELAAFTPHWQAARQQVVLPRLVVMLDTPLAHAASFVLERRASEIQPPRARDSLANNLLALTVSGTAGPVLYLDTDAKSKQLEEISAAILAMR